MVHRKCRLSVPCRVMLIMSKYEEQRFGALRYNKIIETRDITEVASFTLRSLCDSSTSLKLISVLYLY